MNATPDVSRMLGIFEGEHGIFGTDDCQADARLHHAADVATPPTLESDVAAAEARLLGKEGMHNAASGCFNGGRTD